MHKINGAVYFTLFLAVASTIGLSSCTKPHDSVPVFTAPDSEKSGRGSRPENPVDEPTPSTTPVATPIPSITPTPTATATPTPTPTATPAPSPVQSGLCDTNYKTNSCEYKFDQGETLQPEPQSNVQSIYFGKKLDLSRLSPTLKSSPMSIYEFQKSIGLEVYTTKRDCGCNVFEKIPAAPEPLMKYWNNIDKDSLLGLFLPIVQAAEALVNVQPKNPILLLRADTDKWTLVHEYTHFLFDFQRTQNEGVVTSDLKDKFRKAIDPFITIAQVALNATGDAVVPSSLQAYATAYINFASASLDLHTSYTLEEVTIESFLSKQYEAGQFTQITPYARYGAAGYINAKYYEFITQLAFLKKGVSIDEQTGASSKLFAGAEDLIVQIGESKEPNLMVLKDQLIQLQNRMVSIYLELNQLEKQYVEPLKFIAGKQSFLSRVKGCSHDQQNAEFGVKNIRKLFKNNYNIIYKDKFKADQLAF